MNITQIEINLQKIISKFSKDDFIYDLLLAYGQPKASITHSAEKRILKTLNTTRHILIKTSK